MAFPLTQETFNGAVQENINDLDMSPEEAITEAVSQFKAQGADLSQVILDLNASSSISIMKKAVEKLSEFKDKPLSPQDCSGFLTALKQECDKGIQYRVQAGKLGAYNVILDILSKPELDDNTKAAGLKTMLSLMTKQPDLLNEKGAQIIVSGIKKNQDVELLRIFLKLCKECCVMHEMNRQKFIELQIVDNLTELLKEGNSQILKELLVVIRALVLDDDVRVEFGHAHEHARIMATEALSLLIELIKQYKTDEAIINEVILTLSSVLVRAEFCLKVEEAGGLEVIQEIMQEHLQNEKIIRQCFKLIKALAGQDECKVQIIQKGFAPVISNCLNTHQKSVPAAASGLNCIAALSLRCPDNSKVLFEAAVPDVIVSIMTKHPDEKSIQKTASWAIRNMVSRSRYQNKYFLELGVENLLQNNLAKFKEFEYDIKAALRDLDCNVQLKEEWTGKGGKITSESSIELKP